jgi:PAS domain S-box-containing protein
MSQKVKVLLIEDNEEHVILFRHNFGKLELGSTLLVHERTLADGLQRLQGEIKFHVVFLDLNLEDSQGFNTFARVHSAGNNVPIVILTATSEPSIIRQALSCGAQDYLAKFELNAETLERSIQHAMWRGSAEQTLQTKVRELEVAQEQLRVMNQQLAHTQSEHEELLNTIDGVVWEAEVGKPTYTFVSNQVEKLLGYPTEKWLKEVGFWKSIILEEDASRIIGPGYRESFEKHDTQLEYRLKKADGEPIWIREYIKVIEENGVPSKLRGIMVDISNRKRAEEALRQAESEAVRATNLKSDFLAHMSHEIRTPLNAIIGMASLALEGTLTSDQLECMGTIRTAGNTLLMLINDILDFSKIEAGMFQLEMSDFKLSTVLNQGLDVVSLTARRKNIRLETHLDPLLPEYVKGDQSAILRVTLNLMGNAVKFTPDHGQVKISMTVVDHKDDDYRIRVEVKDSGVGIAPEKQKWLFQPFSQADNSMSRKYGGTGLGLSISKQLVNLMQGSIGLESDLGLGSTFHFEIPLKKSQVATVAEPKPRSNEPRKQTNNIRVLVAEDNVLNQRVIKRLLEQVNCGYELAINGREAVEMFTAWPFDMVIMDCQMPEMDGYAATIAMRKIEAEEGRARTPIVALTAHAFVEDRRKCERAGMDDYLSKPITGAQLDACIERWTSASKVKEEKGGAVMTNLDRAIDTRFIDRLIELNEPSSQDFVVELIDLFQADALAHLERVRDAFDRLDLTKLENEAHSFKSSCRNVGAHKLAAQMENIEFLAHKGNLTLLQANRDLFLNMNAEELTRVMAELKSIKIERTHSRAA